MTCLLCGKETERGKTDYCPTHNRAYDSVRRAFSIWTTAYGNITLPDYLERVGKLPGTGQAAREIVEFLRRNPARWEQSRH